MIWLFIAALLAAILVVTLWCVRRPLRHRNVRLADFDRYFEAWVPKLTNGALIFIREEASRHFVQFGVYRSDREAVVQFALPEADWSVHLFGDVSSALKRAGFDARIESTDVEAVPRFLVCDLPVTREGFARDIAEVARTALVAMGHEASGRFTLWCEGDFNPRAPVSSLEKLRNHPSANVRRWAEGRLAQLDRE